MGIKNIPKSDPPTFVFSKGRTDRRGAEIIGFGSNAFSVREIDRERACALVRKNHYSRTICNGSFIHLGVFTKTCRGVLQFGFAMNPASQGSIVQGTKQDEYLELNRMWLADSMPKNSESRAISYALKFIRRKYPKIAWIQSFADERCSRLGVVYQASNFLFVGEHTATFWELDGSTYHNSLMTRNPSLTPKAKLLQDNRERATPHRFRQFRYIIFLKQKARRNLNLAVGKFPKPAGEGSMESRPFSKRKGRGRFPHSAPI